MQTFEKIFFILTLFLSETNKIFDCGTSTKFFRNIYMLKQILNLKITFRIMLRIGTFNILFKMFDYLTFIVFHIYLWSERQDLNL